MSKSYSIEKLILHPKWKWDDGMLCILNGDKHVRYSERNPNKKIIGVSLSDIATHGCLLHLLTKQVGHVTTCYDSHISPSWIIRYWEGESFKIFYGTTLGDGVCQALADFWNTEEK